MDGIDSGRRRDRLRGPAVTVALVVASGLLLAAVAPHYPLAQWLLLRYLGYWLAALVWFAGCLALGHLTVQALLGRRADHLEHLSVAFAIGLFEFELVMFLLGIARLYGTTCFLLVPASFLVAGGPSLARYAVRLARRIGPRRRRTGLSAGRFAILAFGCLVLLMVYLPLLTPANVCFDSYWRHMSLAESYAAQGGIRPFPEGWVFAASPHFTSLLFAWAFLLPAGGLFDRIELCGHLEYVIFLWTTLVGIPALVRRLVRGADVRIVWVARCLFPGFLLYDSSLSVGVDHIGAVYAAPLFLVGLRIWRRPGPRAGLLLGALLAGAASVKETTAALLTPMPVLLVVTGALLAALGMRTQNRGRRHALAAALAAGVAGTLLSAPHWLKNLVFYGDPLYPVLHGWFADRPWYAGAAYVYRWVFLPLQRHTPTVDLQGLGDSLWTVVSFSFAPHDLTPFHGTLPVFGSLFTLLLICLPFLRGTARIWLVVLWVHGAVFVWCWVNREDRYLQVLMPWIAAATAAIMHLVWRRFGPAARGALVLLVGIQLAWGSDVYFFPTHAMLGTSPIRVVAEMIGKGYEGKYEERSRTPVDFMGDLGTDVPEAGRLLIHNERGLLGTGVPVAVDQYGEQFGIDYAGLATPRAVNERFQALGITHVAWVRGRGYAEVPLADEIVFQEFATRYTVRQRDVRHFRVGAIQTEPPAAARGPRLVALYGCGAGGYAPGTYRLEDLTVPSYGPRRDRYPAPLSPLPTASDRSGLDFVALVVDPGCGDRFSGGLPFGYRAVAGRPRGPGPAWEIWLPREPDRSGIRPPP